MTFDASKPQASESPSAFPAQAQANWSRLETMISADHQFNDTTATNDGKHNKARFIEQDPAPSTAANEVALYSKEANSISELFLRRESDGNEIQISTGDVRANTRGYTFLPGGVILQWGIISSPSNGLAIAFTDGSGIDFPNNIWCINITPVAKAGGTTQDRVGAPRAGTISKTGFTLNWTASTSYTQAYWQAIGN